MVLIHREADPHLGAVAPVVVARVAMAQEAVVPVAVPPAAVAPEVTAPVEAALAVADQEVSPLDVEVALQGEIRMTPFQAQQVWGCPIRRTRLAWARS